MRGSPPLHLLVCFIAFVICSVPLARLTFARPEVPQMKDLPAVESAPTSAGTPTLLRLRFAHLPQSLSVKLGDQELLPLGTKLVSPLDLKMALPLSSEDLELLLQAKWPLGTTDTAITVELEPDALDARSQTRWSANAELQEVLSFQW
jgi:hypothetical protein